MIKLSTLITFIVLGTVACVYVPAHPPVPTPPPSTARAVSVYAYDEIGHPAVGVDCAINTLDNPPTWAHATSNGDGYLLWPVIPAELRATQVNCAPTDAFNTFSSHRDLSTGGNEWLTPNLTLPSAHVSPFTRPLDQVLKIRGGLFSTYAGGCKLPFGIRPDDPTNIVFFGAYWYNDDQLDCTNDVWRGLGYTHGIMGPFIAQGYHGQTPDQDVTISPESSINAIAQIHHQIDAGFNVWLVLVPDHCGAKGIPGVCGPWQEHVWTVEELEGSELETFYRSPEFQAVADLVQLCWECQGSKYGWSNQTYVKYLRWVSKILPNARLIALHVISDIEAPVGNGDETDINNCHGKTRWVDCLTNGEAWMNASVAAGHRLVFAHQSNALFDPTHIADNHKTDAENWLELWDANNPASFVRRFSDPGVYGDWPKDVIPVPWEYLSIKVYNGERQMGEAQDWGTKAKARGAIGAMDGVKVQ